MSNLEKFCSDFELYFRHYPFMTNKPWDELDGNGILYAGTYALLHERLFGSYLGASEHSALLYKQSYLPEQPGVITRGPHKWNDPQTHDDYVGLASMSALGNRGAAIAIYNHGRSHLWNFSRNGHNSLAEIFNSQFQRLAGLVQHLKLCAGVNLNPLDILIWAAGVYFNSLSARKETSGTILRWHMIRIYELSGKKNWLSDMAVRNWKNKTIQSYPNGMGEVFGIYYGTEHPFAKWANGII